MNGYVKTGNSWKALVQPHVKVGGAWKGVQAAYVKVGGAWKKFFAFLSVAMPNRTVDNTTLTPICVAGLRLNTDGTFSETNSAGTYSTAGTWLTGGSASAVWVERTITSGSLNRTDPGTGRLQLNVARSYEVDEDTDPGTHACTFTLTFYDASTGGNVLDTATITLEANVV